MGGTPPTHLVTEDDHGAWLSSVAGILVAWMALTLGLRVFIRLRFNGPWKNDDTVCAIGSALAVCQTGVMIAAVSKGYGKKLFLLDSSHISYVQKALYASDILYIASLACSKISTSFLISRLTRQKSHSLFSLTINILSLAWGVASIFAIAIRCDFSHPWTFNANTGFCISQYSRWIGLETTSMLLEALLFALSINLVWGLQMAFRLKAIVVAAFSSRIFIVVPAAVRLFYLSPSQNPRVLSPNSPTPDTPIYEPFFTEIYAALITQVVLHYALIAATIPCTKPFMKAFAGSLAVTSEGASSRGTDRPSGYGRGYGGGYGMGSSTHSSSGRQRPLHSRGGSGSKPILGSAGNGAASMAATSEKADGPGVISAGRDSAFSRGHSRGPSAGSAVGGVGRPGTARATSAGSDVNRTRTSAVVFGDGDARRLDPGAGESTAVAEHAGDDATSQQTQHSRVLLGTLPGVGKKDGLPSGSENRNTEWTGQMVIQQTRDVNVDYERTT